MINLRKFALSLALVMSSAIAGVAFAQNAAQTDPNKKGESCCAMDSCCCKGDACKMMKHGATHNHAMASDKHECCCGDSCSMKKDGAAASDKHECCKGDACKMKEGASKNNATTSDKHECCCCGDSCEMKDSKDTKNKP